MKQVKIEDLAKSSVNGVSVMLYNEVDAYKKRFLSGRHQLS